MTHTPIINFDSKLFTDSWSDESNSEKRPQKMSIPKEQPLYLRRYPTRTLPDFTFEKYKHTPNILRRHTHWGDESHTEYWKGKNNAEDK